MSILFEVVTRITLPIVVLAAAGYALQKWARFDVTTLNRLLVYATFPCFIVVTLSKATIPLSQVQGAAAFTLVQFALLLALGWWVGKGLGLARDLRAVVAIACAFPAVALGLGLNALDWRLPKVIETPMDTLGQGYVGIALFALGAQLAANDLRVPLRSAGLAVALRLLLAPALTALVLLVVPLPRGVEHLLIVGACAPVGILVAIFAAEFRGNVELASAVVIASTLLSPIVVTAVLVLIRM